jgi:hypothetical protein
MADTPRKSRSRVNPFAIVIGGFLMLVALAAIYLGLADPLHLWPYERS